MLEAPATLLDWGVKRRYRKEKSPGETSLCRRLRSLLEVWRPSLVVTKAISKPMTARTQRLLAGLLAEARRCRIPVHRFPEQAIRGAFSGENRTTKHTRASTMLDHFPFLASTLPPKRRIWESEDYRMSMLDAIALALAASGQRHTANR